MKKLLGVIALLLTALLLSACGDGSDTSSSSDDSASTDAGTAQFNDADVTFAQGMIPHHQQAVVMAQMADGRAHSAEVKQLAADIEAAQAPEIEQLTAWLKDWGAEVPSGSMGPDGMGDDDMGDDDSTSDMSEMMSAEDMGMLESSAGASWDRMFLTMMTEHHRGAVKMAMTEVAEGENPDAIAMANGIISTQRAEIQQMQEMLHS